MAMGALVYLDLHAAFASEELLHEAFFLDSVGSEEPFEGGDFSIRLSKRLGNNALLFNRRDDYFDL